VLDYATLTLREHAVAHCPTTFPYVPGLLSFREIPAILQAYRRLRNKPDLIICDGQGYAHPRRFGLASHLGVFLDIPSIGVAKTLLVGSHGPLARKRGSRSELRHDGEVVGVALRTRGGVKPVFVSAGHRVSLASAIAIALHCAPKYRLPETTRWAHKLASQKS
jgi:deoxyribonuclease V